VLVQSVLDADRQGDAKAGHHGRLAAALTDAKTYVLASSYFCWRLRRLHGHVLAADHYQGPRHCPRSPRSAGTTAVPYIFGALGVLVISRSSDRFKERRCHVGGTLVLGAVALASTSFLSYRCCSGDVLLCIAAFFQFFGGGSLFWSIPPDLP